MCSYCLVEPSLRHPDVSQNKRATDRNKDVAGHPHIRHEIGKGPMGRLQVSARPVCDRQERSWDSTREIGALRQEIECPPSVRHGAGHIAERLGMSGTGGGYRRWERPKLLFVHDDHLSRWAGTRVAFA